MEQVNNRLVQDKLIRNYWIQKVKNIDEAFVKDSGVPTNSSICFDAVSSLIPLKTKAQIKHISKHNEVTEYVVYLSFLGILLHKYFERPKILIASSGFNGQDVSADTPPVFYILQKGDGNFKSYLKAVGNEVRQSLNYQKYDFKAFIAHLERTHENVGGLYQFGLIDRRIHNTTEEFQKVQLQFVLTEDDAGNKGLSIHFNRQIYDKLWVEQLSAHYLNLMAHGVFHLDDPINQVDMLTAVEKETLLQTFNNTRTVYPHHHAIHHLFEIQVQKTPGAVAMVSEEETYTYQHLNEKANQLAHILINEYHLKPEELVGVMVSRSPYYVVAILGILKAGGAYLPLDPAYPEERIRFMVEDTQINTLIIHSDFMFEVGFFAKSLVAIDIQLDNSTASVANPERPVKATDLAYVMYTSGSTGKPKGVMVEHKGVVRLVQNTRYIDFSGHKRLLLNGSLSFDATTFEIWGMLLNGGSLYIFKEDKLLKPIALKAAIWENSIDTLWLTTGWFNQLIDEDITLFAPLKQVISGGEKQSPQHIQRLRHHYPDLKVINGYGPTENTTFSACCEVKEDYKEIPLGIPISNSTAYVLDENMNLLPIGVEGEIYLGGDGVTRGYLNQPELTYEKFVPNPFTKRGYLYKSGDRGRWQFDGQLYFSGRKDTQVKVRGFRVELSEVESVMKTHPKVKEAVVIARKDSKGFDELLGYYSAETSLEAPALRQYLVARLPAYMVPLHLCHVQHFPLTLHGKINRKALPDPSGFQQTGKDNYVAPQDAIEEKLVDIWKEVLELSIPVGIRDNFFEIGGHSLRATQVLTRVLKIFNTRIDLGDVFAHPTIEEMARLIRDKSYEEVFELIPVVPEQDYYDLSHAQKRFWILNQFSKDRVAYNVPGAYVFDGLDRSAFEKTVKALLHRHDVLRTSFTVVEGEAKQQVHKAEQLDFKVPYYDVSHDPHVETSIREIAFEEANTPFDLEKAPLLRVKLLRKDDTHFVCLFTMHHIIADGWSIRVLMRDFLQLYQAFLSGQENPLSPLPIQYKDYVYWQKKELQAERLKKHQEYWWRQFDGEIPVLNFPTDHLRPSVKTTNGKTYIFTIPPAINAKLNQLCQRFETSKFILFCTLIKAWLYCYCKQKDIVIGAPAADRNHPELEDQIGLYLNTLALRSRFSEEDSFERLLLKVKENVLQAYKHQVYPYDLLIEELDLPPERSRNPLFDVGINFSKRDYDQLPEKDEKLENMKVDAIDTGFRSVKTDLWFNINDSEKQTICYLDYNTDLFKDKSVEKFVSNFQTLTTVIADQSQISLTSLAEIIADQQLLRRREKQKNLKKNNLTLLQNLHHSN